MPITLYGIPNCDTVKKARAWLDARAAAYTFHDYKKQGVPQPDLQRWMAELGWEALVNRKGTTWRQLDEATRAKVVDAASAQVLLSAQPSAIKRPVVRWNDGRVTVGFEADEFDRALGA
jgi:Spx/MgsR family transcriptional regulator